MGQWEVGRGGRGRVGEQNQFGGLKSAELAEGASDGTKKKSGSDIERRVPTRINEGKLAKVKPESLNTSQWGRS